MIINNQMAARIGQLGNLSESPTQNAVKQAGSENSFQSLLNKSLQKSEELTFSKHAHMRMQSRNISLTKSQFDRLQQGVEQAKDKGIQDSLMLMDGIAFVVNVPNSTVITALDQQESTKHIFTNIDGAVIV